MTAPRVEVTGLREFSRALKKFDADAPKALRVALNDAVGIVLDYAKPRIPKRTGRAANSVRGSSTRTVARVSMGGRRAPYMPWLDFGGAVGPRKSVRRPFIKEGRYLYKALGARRAEFTDAMEGAIVRVARSAGLEVD